MGEIKNILSNITKNNEDLYENNDKIMKKIEKYQKELSEMKDMKLQVNYGFINNKSYIYYSSLVN